MSRYPEALWRPLPENTTEPLIRPRLLIFHSAVSKANSLWGYFNSPGINLESHFYMQEDADLEQYIDTHRQADANYLANDFAISVESWDNRDPDKVPWSPAQIEKLAHLALWAHREHSIPLVRAPSWDGAGMGGHSDYPGKWTNVKGKTCPGIVRRPQISEIIQRARVLSGLVTPKVEDNEMVLKRGDKGRAVLVFQRALNKEADGVSRPEPRLKEDGDFGPATETRVKQYQNSAQLPQTGVIDGITAALVARYDSR